MADTKVVTKTKKDETNKSLKETKKAVSKTASKTTAKTVKKSTNSEEFAVIFTGGKQYIVAVGDVVTIEKLEGEHKEGDKITFDKVLLVDNGKDTTTIGTPYIDGAKVIGVFQEEGKGKKLHVIRFKSKSRYLRKYGHRQPYNKVKIEALK